MILSVKEFLAYSVIFQTVNLGPIFYSEGLLQITIGDFSKDIACGHGVVPGNYCELGVKNRMRIFQNWEKSAFFYHTKILGRLLDAGSVHAKC